jgi:hypothetical protein
VAIAVGDNFLTSAIMRSFKVVFEQIGQHPWATGPMQSKPGESLRVSPRKKSFPEDLFAPLIMAKEEDKKYQAK